MGNNIQIITTAHEAIAAIKAEVKRRMDAYNVSIEKYARKQKSLKSERDSWKWAECKSFLAFLDTIESEEKAVDIADAYSDYMDDKDDFLWNGEQLYDLALHFYDLGCRHTAVMYDEIEYNRQRSEEAGNEEFEKELHQYWLEQKQKGVIVDGSIDDYITVQEVARHFAEWGAKHQKK